MEDLFLGSQWSIILGLSFILFIGSGRGLVSFLDSHHIRQELISEELKIMEWTLFVERIIEELRDRIPECIIEERII